MSLKKNLLKILHLFKENNLQFQTVDNMILEQSYQSLGLEGAAKTDAKRYVKQS